MAATKTKAPVKKAAPTPRATKKKWRGVVLETKKNYDIEATTYAAAKTEMKKVSGMPEHTGSKVNWALGLP